MEIELKERTVELGSLSVGDIFMDGDRDVCIKTDETNSDGEIKVVDLCDGIIFTIEIDVMVTPLNVKLVEV